MSRAELAAEDLLPSPEDDKALFEDAVVYIMRFMVTRLKCLAHLKEKLESDSAGMPMRSEVVALEIMDVDESSTNNNIQILETFCRDTGKTQPCSQVFLAFLITSV